MLSRKTTASVAIGGLALALLAGCASSGGADTSAGAIMSRVDAHRKHYDSWPPEAQAAILDGRVVRGMTPEMVEVALGKPAEITNRSSKHGDEEVWVYRKSSGGGNPLSKLGSTGIAIGAGPVVVGSNNIGGSGGQDEPEEQEIVFRDGVVVDGGAASK